MTIVPMKPENEAKGRDLYPGSTSPYRADPAQPSLRRSLETGKQFT